MVFACLCLPLFAGGGQEKQAAASEWVPVRAFEMIVPGAAGGSTDLLGRAVEKIWSKYCPQPIRVVNKPGGGGVIGAVAAATATPDGYTMTLGYGSGWDVSMPHLQKLEYDPFTALDPICLLSIHTVMVAAPASSEFKSMADILDWTKRTGKTAQLSSSTANGTVDLVLQAFAKRTGANVTIIQTAGGGESINMLIGAQVHAGGNHPSELLPHFKAGRVKLLGVATDARDNAMPDVPTFKEQGINFSAYGSIKGIAVPKKMPENIKKYLEATFQKVAHDPEFKKIMTDMGQPVDWMNTKDFTAFFQKAYNEYKVLIEELGLAYWQKKN